MPLFMGNLSIERGKCLEYDGDGGGYSYHSYSEPTPPPTITYLIENQTVKKGNGDIILIQKINKKNIDSFEHDENVEIRESVVDDLKGSRGLVGGLLCSTVGRVSQFKEMKTNSFNKTLAMRRDLKYEYLYYRREILRLGTVLEYAKKEIPVDEALISKFEKESEDLKAGFTIVKQLIRDMDARFPQINMEKEMRKRLPKVNAGTIFQEIMESDLKLSEYRKKYERSRWNKDEYKEAFEKEVKINKELRKIVPEHMKKRIS